MSKKRSRMNQRDRLSKIVLSELKKHGPLHRTDIHKKTLAQCGTPATFNSIFNYLKGKGFIKKTSDSHRAPYAITENGEKFLEVI